MLSFALVLRFFGVMPVYSARDSTLACKLVSFYPGNAKHGKPTHLANIMLYDPTYGELKAVRFLFSQP